MVLFGTEDTSNALADRYKGQYQNVSTAHTISKVDQDLYRQLDNFEAAESATGGDLIDGLVTALDMIERHCGTKKYKKRVFLITDGETATQTNTEEINNLIDKLNEKGIRLNIIALDFANELGEDESDQEEESRPSATPVQETAMQTNNKRLLMQITD